jgi:inosose dehydratase
MDKENVRIAIAPIGWTNDDIPELGGNIPFEQCISEMALAGYRGSEVGNKYPSTPSILREYLQVRGLQICNKWFSSYLIASPLEEVVKSFRQDLEYLKALGAEVIGPSEQTRSCQGKPVSVFSGKPQCTTEEFKRLTAGMNHLGRIASDEGLRLAYHHHMGTGIQTIEETERFLNDTNPDVVYLLYDSGHFAFSGEDPVAALEKFVSRVGHVHLKDLRKKEFVKAKNNDSSFLDAVREGVFTVPGDGDIDFTPIFKILEEENYQGWMVVEAEQDPGKANPFLYAKMGRDYIREKTGI